MKRLIFLLTIVCMLILIGCTKEKPVKVKKEVTKTATVDYSTSLADMPKVKALKPGGMLIIFVDTGEVATTKVVGYVWKLRGKCRYGYLDNLLNVTNVSCAWKGKTPNSRLVIEDQGDLNANYEFFENFFVLDSNRIYTEISDTVRFKDSNGKFLRTY